MPAALLDIDHVSKRFVKRPNLGEQIAGLLGAGRKTEIVRAVSDVSLTVAKGEVVGLVGESGCGKSTLGRMVAGIYTPSDGKILFGNAPVAKEQGRRTHKLTTRVQMIHQDPFASLNPRIRIGDTVSEGPVAHNIVKAREADSYVADLLGRVGLDPSYRRRFPHQFSGGQRQRIAIARALAMKPDLLVLDEPVASLDVSIQAQVLNLFMDLRSDLDLTGIFISHDLGVVRHVSDRVAIMYLGRIVELAPTAELYAKPNHPYTRALFESVPRVGVGRKNFRPIAGEIPSPLNPPSGCHFHPRCPFAGPRCKREAPPLEAIGPGRFSACHLNTGGTD
ncbi:ABC transporter ATP-binding protein [Microvirga sp. BT689]|uniref:ABC transporter ATP-binding protein n=1 Tax=Microvirga arvi TaxID=2778731 RepID=UPI001950D907|nr:ABC transporter ATP-binding protein [Microvirga arvi]MBM6579343.1 ABC transporter ATP-binding protein [Microvirga arvi]